MRVIDIRPVVAGGLVSCGLLVACGKVAGDSEEGRVVGLSDAGSDAAAAASDSSTAADALPYLEVDASKRTDATVRVEDMSACATRTPCDCDGDGFADVACGADAGTLKPGDCDDLDPLRFPGQGFVMDPPPPGHDGDWNCDGIEEVLPAMPPACTRPPNVCLVGERGFSGRGRCGEVEDLRECGHDPLQPSGCGPLLVGQARRPCR